MQDSDAKEERMAGEEFSRLRKILGKSRKELAEILGISRKAVESYEQGWRRVPVNTERMLYFLLFKLRAPLLARTGACWEIQGCAESARMTCLTWLAKEGHFCWFFTGRLCAARKSAPDGGAVEGDANDLSFCRTCSVFRGMTELLKENPEPMTKTGETACP